MGPPEQEAIRLFARSEGLLLDPVYTGRAAAGLLARARQGLFAPGETVLFWHTGGAPALFADRYRELVTS
jgi:1-aminocyclopropane-1-carboxylate deaminase/D-cysteine desulfhydrase-like pyridoxal-dependent ACC family enzyme